MAQSTRRPRRPEGIAVRHSIRCATRDDRRCDCAPGYQAQVYSAPERRTIRKTFPSLADARAWRAEAQAALRRGTLRAPSQTTLSEAARDWLEAARAGVVRTRSGDRYKPSAIRAYELALRTKLLPELGDLRLSEITRNTVQDLADGLIARGTTPSTTRNAFIPLRAIYRRLLARSEVVQNPTHGLALPAVRSKRDRIAHPAEARALLDVLRPEDQPVWATALYAGLRRGELMALRWGDVDFEAGLVRVERSWDQKEGPIEPKSRAGYRKAPLARPLRSYLAAHRLRCRGGEDSLCFTRASGKPFASHSLTNRARTAWQRAGLKQIGLHECRHTYAAFMIAAGVNAKALSTYMGHSTITITLDRYGHLMPGNEDEAAGALADYLEREAGA